jgi:hypothetical protein
VFIKAKWVRSIHRSEEFQPTASSRVCIKHFAENHIIREHRAVRDDNTVLVIPRKRIKLTEDAYPTIFANQPAYMSQMLPPKRKDPRVREEEIALRLEHALEEINLADTINSFEDLKLNITNKFVKYNGNFESKVWRLLVE